MRGLGFRVFGFQGLGFMLAARTEKCPGSFAFFIAGSQGFGSCSRAGHAMTLSASEIGLKVKDTGS